MLELDLSPVKRFDFSWPAAMGADRYRLLESATPGAPFEPLGDDIVGESLSVSMPLHFRLDASYVLQACNGEGCTDSEPVIAAGPLAEAVGYFKASNTDESDYFGSSLALSGDGNTLAVGAFGESSSATGIDGDQADDSAFHAGAVYVFVRDATGGWSQQAYVKASDSEESLELGAYGLALSEDGNTLAVGAYGAEAVYLFVRDATGTWSQRARLVASNSDSSDYFGISVALSGDANTLAVGAPGEDGSATGIGGDQIDDSAVDAGAVYVFTRDEADQWSQQTYVKASNTDVGDQFGSNVALSDDGDTLAVGALEDSNATGIGGDQADDSAPDAGAVYIFSRSVAEGWSQQAYIKASNTDAGDYFGSVALSGDGNTLVVGAGGEDSNAIGIGGDQDDDSAPRTGAVYVFVRDAMSSWSQQAYVKASNPGPEDSFGGPKALSGDGNVLAIGAAGEGSNAIGIGGDQAYDSEYWSGAVYVLVRDDMGQWVQRAYVKASNTGAGDEFGNVVALSSDGNTLAVGARLEDGNATGIGGDQAGSYTEDTGAVYLY